MTHLIAIDPGVNATAFAVFTCAHAKLVYAGMSVRAKACHTLGSLARVHSLTVANLCEEFDVSRVVVEEMRHYPGGGKARHVKDAQAGDLLHLAFIGGALACAFGDAPIRTVPALEWKGSVPKEITQRRVLATLAADEREVLDGALIGFAKGLQHNIFDAVGIGLYSLGRGTK